MRRAIALALALLVTSACTVARKPAWELPPPPASIEDDVEIL